VLRTSQPRIAVIGAGIGGLAVAAALAQAGIGCEVFEQATYLAQVGAGIQLAPNAVRLLHRLGLRRHLSSVGVRPDAIHLRHWDDGRTIARTPLADCETVFGAPYYAVHRADLHRGLLELLPPGTVRLGLRCEAIEEQDDGVELTLSGGHACRASLVIGADGIHSVVRAALTSDRPRFSGQLIYRGLVAAEKVPFLVEEPAVRLWLGPGQHCVSYPVSGGRQVSFGATQQTATGGDESWSAQGEIADVREAYHGWHPEVRKLLGAADTVGRWALHDRDTISRWSTSRLTLVGDAAHPMLPFLAQGANQAVEDAVVLALCLQQHGLDDIETALDRYQQLRVPRTTEVHTRSRANTKTLHLADGPDQSERDTTLGGGSGLAAQEWLYGYDAESAVTGRSKID
jgi:salicylate hydroxylase